MTETAWDGQIDQKVGYSCNMKSFLRGWTLYLKSWCVSVRNRLMPNAGKYRRSPSGVAEENDLSPSKSYLHYADLVESRRNSVSRENNLMLSQSGQREQLKKLIRFRKIECAVVNMLPWQCQDEINRSRVSLSFGRNQDCPVDILARSDQDPESDLPLMICMQGYNSGAHLSLGEIWEPFDVYKVEAGSSIAIQAARLGYRVISYERPCFGERQEKQIRRPIPNPTVDAAFSWLMMGRTLIGETVAELNSLISWAQSRFPNSKKKIFLSGYSAAGTTAIFTAAIDERITGIAVGGCVGMFRDTVMQRGTGGYVAVPDLLLHFELDTILSLIAPRICVLVSGVNDHIYPYAGAEKCIRLAREHFAKLNASEALVHLSASGGHTYYPNLLWPCLVETIRRREVG